MFFHTFLNSVRKYHKIPSSTIFFPISSCGSCSDHLLVYYEVVRQHHKYEQYLHSALLLSITCNTYLSSSIHFHNHIRVILSLDFVLSCLSCSIRISIYVLGCTGLPLLIDMYHLTYAFYCYSKPISCSSTWNNQGDILLMDMQKLASEKATHLCVFL